MVRHVFKKNISYVDFHNFGSSKLDFDPICREIFQNLFVSNLKKSHLSLLRLIFQTDDLMYNKVYSESRKIQQHRLLVSTSV